MLHTHSRRIVTNLGEFRNGRGEVFDSELSMKGAFLFDRSGPISSATSRQFEQAFSEDGGKTWEVNWIATDTRMDDEANKP
jgi:hypothetical protein